MYARQLGFLHAEIDGSKGVTRLSLSNDRKIPPDLPVISAGMYIIEAMNVLGPIRFNGASIVATDWDIILPFVQATNRLSETWELEVLAEMCLGYRNALIAGANPLGISPMKQEENNIV